MTKKPPADDLLLRLRQELEALPPAERKLADTILNHPGSVATCSASELAGMAGVSNAAMTRLCQRLGFGGFDQMRRLARAGIDWGSPLFLLDRQTKKKARASDQSFDPHVEASIDNIRSTFAAMPTGAIDALARAIVNARQVRLYGQRNSYFLAAYLRWQIVQFRGNVFLLPAPGETLGEYLVSLGAEDVVIAFGLRRRTRTFHHFLQAVHHAKARVAVITDGQDHQPYEADWVLRCDTKSGMPLDNHAAVMTLCHVLSARVIELSGSKGRDHLARIEHLHTTLKEM